jgi:hypothetical protein
LFGVARLQLGIEALIKHLLGPIGALLRQGLQQQIGLVTGQLEGIGIGCLAPECMDCKFNLQMVKKPDTSAGYTPTAGLSHL